MKKFLSALTAAILAGAMLTGCGAQPAASPSPQSEAAPSSVSTAEAAPITLKLYAQYSSDDEKEPLDYAIEKLKGEIPNLSFEIDVAPQDDNAKLKTYAASGLLPDIFFATSDVQAAFAKSGSLLTLDDYAAKMGVKEKMNASAANLLTLEDGHTYAFPYIGNDVVLLYYNKSLLADNGIAVPKTYDDLMKASETLNAKGIVPLSLFGKEKWNCISLFDLFASRSNHAGINALNDGSAKISDPAFAEAAQTVIDLAKAGFVSKNVTNTNYDQALAAFTSGQAAMFMSGEWEIPSLTQAMGDNFDYMYIPAKDEAAYEANKYAFSGGGSSQGYAVSSQTADKDFAAEVAFKLAYYQAEGRYVLRANPVSPYSLDNVKPQNEIPPVMQKLSADMPNITSTTNFSWGMTNTNLKVALEDAAQSLLVDGYTAEKFVADVSAAQ